MTRKYFVSFALLAAMVTPAVAAGTHTINVWGAQFEIPDQGMLFGQPLPKALQTSQPSRWTGTLGAPLVHATSSVAPLYAGNEDGDNAKKSALPPNERSRGKKTGGPARMQILD
jgi:hypothetical protein